MSRFLRQQGLVNTGSLLLTKVSVIGAGGIGSPIVLALAKMGIGNITVWDHDIVEEHNTGSQLYRNSDIGVRKVVALGEIVRELTGLGIYTMPEKVDKRSLIDTPVVISALDAMEVRYELAEALGNFNRLGIVIDIRAGAEELRFIVSPTVQGFKDTLYPDREALPLPCTARAIIYTGFIAAGIVASIVKAHVVKAITEPYQLALDVPTMQVLRL